MSNEIAIKVERVSKNFKLPHEKIDSVKSIFVNPFRSREGLKTETQHALHGIDFEVKKGEFFGIVGRNGSGKSTLLKIIAGIYQPTKGSVTVNGRLVPFIELGVGFNPELTGRENVYLNGALMGFDSKEIDIKYEDIVRFAELERFMDQKLKNYSSGMQVRLSFSVATILADSDILLIDEVLAVGDSSFQRKCFDYFKNLKKLKKTVIFVSHDMNAVREYCDRAILIEKSEIVFAGSSEETAKEYTRLFLPELYKSELEANGRDNKREDGKWGSGGVDILDVHASKRTYQLPTDKWATIYYKVRASGISKDESLIVGLSIKDSSGRAICGTNSKIVQYSKAIKFTGGDTIGIEWRIPNIFSEGNYFIEPAVVSGDTGDLLQWWDDAAQFGVINEQATPYPVSPVMELKVTKS